MSKKIVIFWSGGLDSTSLVYRTLKNNPDSKITSIYSEITNNVEKTKSEKRTIKNIKKEFDKFSNYDEHLDLLKIGISGSQRAIIGITQFMVFFTTISLCLRDYDEIQIGYIMNDDACSYINDIQKMYKLLCDEFSTDGDNEFPILTFPLLKYKKWEVQNSLPENILKYVVWCENPKYIKNVYHICMKCNPCLRKAHDLTLTKLPDYPVVPEKDEVVITTDYLEK